MARPAVQGKSPKNTEKKDFQFLNKKGEWQNCRAYWFIVQRKRQAQTRFRLSGTDIWFYSEKEFEDQRQHNSPSHGVPGPGRNQKYGEPLVAVYVPQSWVQEIEQSKRLIVEAQNRLQK